VIIVVGVLPGLSHVLGDQGPQGGVSARQALVERLGKPRVHGLLMDGVWAALERDEPALHVALSLAQAGSAVGLCAGRVDLSQDAPMGLPLLVAAASARAARQGEVLVPQRWLQDRQLPRGVGHFPAPEGLVGHGPELALLKDYR